MKSIEIKGRCKGEQHRIFITIENNKLFVKCPDHDFELDDVELAFGAAPKTRHYCSGIYSAWHGVIGVPLEQVNTCLINAKTHGLTSKVAKQLFGPGISKLLYEGVRSIDFAKELVRTHVYPSRSPFDPAGAESFVTNYKGTFRNNFAELAIAGGCKLNSKDVHWIKQNRLSLGYVIRKINFPDVWLQVDPSLDRDKLNSWWRTLRKYYSDASGEHILTFINTYPLPLKGIEFVPFAGIEVLLTDINPELQRSLYRLLIDFKIDDLPSLLVAHRKNWSIKYLNSMHKQDILGELDLGRKAWVS